MHTPTSKRFKGIPWILVALVAFACPWSLAQEADDSRTIEEIIVVSTKRAQGELSQDVPVPSTLISESMIEENNF